MLLIVFGRKNRQIRKIPFFHKNRQIQIMSKQVFNSDKSVSLIKQDAREAIRVDFFCTYKTYLYAQNEISYEYNYSNIVLKIVLNCINLQIATQHPVIKKLPI